MSRVSVWLKHLGKASLMVGFFVLLLTGCEEDVAGPDPHAYPYSIWGVLNPLADTQFVRVFSIETTLTPGVPEPLDARLTATDLGTGDVHTWRDSVLVDTLGMVGHVFYASFRPEWEHRYRLEITRGDGASSQVEVEIPKRTTLVLDEPDTTRGVVLPASIQGDAQRLMQSEVDIYVSYVVGFTPPPFSLPIFEYLHYIIPYDENLRRTADGWQFTVDLDRSYLLVSSVVNDDENYIPSEGIRLLFVEFRVLVANEEWMPPDGVFDPNVLIQPGVMENVQNGFGFVGGGYHLSRSWTLPFEVVEKTNFRPNR
jgi:hypothetical protein